MNCKDYYIWMSGHIDGANSPREEESLQKHLASCSRCCAVMEAMQANDAVLQRDVLTPPASILNHVMASVRKDAKKKTGRVRNYIISVAAVAAVLCLVFISVLKTPDVLENEPAGGLALNTPVVADCAENADSEEITAYSYGGYAPQRRAVTVEDTGFYHCVFVEVPSAEQVPENISTVEVSEFYSKITREAIDYYYYGGSRMFSATIVSAEEVEQWKDQISFRCLWDTRETDTYVVIFCSESR